MRSVYRDLRNCCGWISILPLADLHIGSSDVAMETIRNLVASAVGDPNMYVVLNGDMIDAQIYGGTGCAYGAPAPGSQIQTAIELLKPLADAGRILCIMDGNHEERVSKAAGISPAQAIANGLGVSDAYVESTALIFLDVGSVSYTAYVTHGSNSTCREVSSKINRLTQLSDIVDADLYISAHSHLPAVFRGGFMRVDRESHKAYKVEHLFVNAASALDYSRYAELQGYAPSSSVYPVISLNGSARDMRVCA